MKTLWAVLAAALLLTAYAITQHDVPAVIVGTVVAVACWTLINGVRTVDRIISEQRRPE